MTPGGCTAPRRPSRGPTPWSPTCRRARTCGASTSETCDEPATAPPLVVRLLLRAAARPGRGGVARPLAAAGGPGLLGRHRAGGQRLPPQLGRREAPRPQRPRLGQDDLAEALTPPLPRRSPGAR